MEVQEKIDVEQEKIGTVSMKPLEALKKLCETKSQYKIGLSIYRFEQKLNEKIKTKEQIPMFTKDTRDKYIRENYMNESNKEKDLER